MPRTSRGEVPTTSPLRPRASAATGAPSLASAITATAEGGAGSVIASQMAGAPRSAPPAPPTTPPHSRRAAPSAPLPTPPAEPPPVRERAGTDQTRLPSVTTPRPGSTGAPRGARPPAAPPRPRPAGAPRGGVPPRPTGAPPRPGSTGAPRRGAPRPAAAPTEPRTSGRPRRDFTQGATGPARRGSQPPSYGTAGQPPAAITLLPKRHSRCNELLTKLEKLGLIKKEFYLYKDRAGKTYAIEKYNLNEKFIQKGALLAAAIALMPWLAELKELAETNRNALIDNTDYTASDPWLNAISPSYGYLLAKLAQALVTLQGALNSSAGSALFQTPFISLTLLAGAQLATRAVKDYQIAEVRYHFQRRSFLPMLAGQLLANLDGYLNPAALLCFIVGLYQSIETAANTPSAASLLQEATSAANQTSGNFALVNATNPYDCQVSGESPLRSYDQWVLCALADVVSDFLSTSPATALLLAGAGLFMGALLFSMGRQLASACGYYKPHTHSATLVTTDPNTFFAEPSYSSAHRAPRPGQQPRRVASTGQRLGALGTANSR